MKIPEGVEYVGEDSLNTDANGESFEFDDSMSISSSMCIKKIYVPQGTKQAYIDALQVKPEYQNMVVEE